MSEVSNIDRMIEGIKPGNRGNRGWRQHEAGQVLPRPQSRKKNGDEKSHGTDWLEFQPVEWLFLVRLVCNPAQEDHAKR